jgi:hypothetical protein
MARFSVIPGRGRFQQIDRLGLSASISAGVIPGAQAAGLCNSDPVTFAFEFLPVAGETIDFDIGADRSSLGFDYRYSSLRVAGASGNEITAQLGERLPIVGGESSLDLTATAPLGVRSLVVVSLVPAGEARLWINGLLVDRVDDGDAIPAPGWAGSGDGRLTLSSGADLTGSRVDVYAGQFPQAYWDGA